MFQVPQNLGSIYWVSDEVKTVLEKMGDFFETDDPKGSQVNSDISYSLADSRPKGTTVETVCLLSKIDK